MFYLGQVLGVTPRRPQALALRHPPEHNPCRTPAGVGFHGMFRLGDSIMTRSQDFRALLLIAAILVAALGAKELKLSRLSGPPAQAQKLG